MLSITVALMLSMAAKDPLEAPRKSYSNCLIELHNEAMKGKTAVADFRKTAEAGCEADKKGYHDAVFAAERKYSNVKDAEEYAASEVTGLIDWIVETYEGNLPDGGLMTKQ